MFDSYIGIDYSGQGSPTKQYPEIQVFEAQAGVYPSRRQEKWSRRQVYDFLAERLEQQQNGLAGRMIVGVDHGFSFPESYLLRHDLSSWDHFLGHFDGIWGYAKNRELFTAESRRSFSYPDQNELRLTEKFTSSAKSVFNFQGITVAFSTHTGIPWLYELRKHFSDVLHFWPFDGLIPSDGKSVIAEVYPSLFYHRYSYPPDLEKRDARDAYAIALWLQEQAVNEKLDVYLSLPTLKPNEIQIARNEGWILGIL
ncbi:hypothetical protein [Alicyclobacillus acidiphilus]|uniref:hypothetical protein n=1 Tax=Alicyclobacillus acidiphilus TaxID=182455 RepID=UPI000837714D|nr:hypothetical protein [Alicyclobacillus acidiphilus]